MFVTDKQTEVKTLSPTRKAGVNKAYNYMRVFSAFHDQCVYSRDVITSYEDQRMMFLCYVKGTIIHGAPKNLLLSN